jgi:hypothetical protein
MATTFKTLLNNDITSTRTLLHEAVPITGTIVSGTYREQSTTTSNIKNYGHGMFQSVYDYPYLSSSANHIFDITVGYAPTSTYSASSGVAADQSKKINIYNQMAQLLVGHDVNGNIRLFDQDGDLSGGNKHTEVFFLNYARLLNKDEIKKGSYTVSFLTGGTQVASSRSGLKTISDYNATNEFRVNSPAGEYGILYTSSATPNSTSGVGLVYYQAGIAVLTASIFGGMSAAYPGGFGHPGATYDTASVEAVIQKQNITASCDGLRNRWFNCQFNNTTELNSTIYFCRANHNDFNYSTNPTYLSGSKIRVKTNSFDMPVSYITTVGLYSADNELLAVAKLSEPIKKQPDTELTLRVRLDY